MGRRAVHGVAAGLGLLALAGLQVIGPDGLMAALGAPKSYVLALSWEPTFCESHGDVPECAEQNPSDVSATRLSLHGLWPQPGSNVYCNVAGAAIEADKYSRWEDLPQPKLSTATRSGLERVMPGTRSFLDRHEWIKHGTCYGTEAEAYFGDAVRLTDDVNGSAAGGFLSAMPGKLVSGQDIRAGFDAAFGPGAGKRVRIACERDGKRQLISEITISLRGDTGAGSGLSKLIDAASPTDPGCPGGVLDPAGLQ